MADHVDKDFTINRQSLENENKKLQEKINILNAKTDSLNLMQQIGHFGSWEIDLKTHKAIWSEQSYRIYKLDPKTTSPTLETFTSHVIDEDKPKLANAMSKLIDGKIQTITLRVKRSDDVIITVLINGKYIFDSHGTPVKLIGTTLDITQQVTLKKRNRELSSIIEHSNNEIYIVELKTYKYLYVNKKALDTLGYTLNEMLHMHIFDINKSLSPQEADTLKKKLIEQGSLSNTTIHTRKDGSHYPIQSYLQYRSYQGKKVCVIFDIDITALVHAKEKEKQQAAILEQIQDSVISTDLNGIITHWNQGATRIHGYSEDEMLGKPIDILYPESEKRKVQWILEETLTKGTSYTHINKITKHKELICTATTAYILKNSDEIPIGITRYSQDITHKQEMEKKLKIQTEKLNFQAYHDALTRLPNRLLFEDRLQQSIANANQHHTKIALFFLDLDNFKKINDTLGHQYGDEVLKITAKRLQSCLHKGDTVARIGGDEFIFIIQNLAHDIDASILAKTLLQSLHDAFKIQKETLYLTASIGISLYPKDSHDSNTLLQYADTAMYKAKEEGKNTYQFYSSSMTQEAFEKSMLEASLHHALEKNQFHVYYQPQVDSRTNTITALEALMRWHHPDMGMIYPDKFIPLAEETQCIQKLDNFVMHKAMSEMAHWHKKHITTAKLALNLSIRQLQNPHFLDIVCENLQKTGFDPHYLEFEITETQMMHNPEQSIQVLHQLTQKGIQISIDDFGTGYSSLAYLKRLPVTKIKIDRSFIEHIDKDEEDASITKAVIALAKSFKLIIVAEGVEHQAQLKCLNQLGCYLAQGYYYSKALPQEEMTAYLHNNVNIQK